MPKGKEKATVAGSSKPVIKDSSTIDRGVLQTLESIKKLRVERINRYKSLANKLFSKQVEESVRLKNIVKIALLSFVSIGNVLLVNQNPIITYIFASITCIAPAMYDYKKNYSLLNEAILKNDRDKNLKKKIEKVIKLTLPGSVGLLIGAMLIGIHISGVGGEVVRDVLLGVATFLAGGGQMLVNPLIRKEVARINLNKLQKKNIDDPEVLKLIEKEVNPEQTVNRIKEIDEADLEQNKTMLNKLSNYLKKSNSLIEDREKKINTEKVNRDKELNILVDVIEIKNLQNDELIKSKEESERATRELTIKTKQEKRELQEDFNKIINEKDFIIQKMENEIRTLTLKQPNYDPELAQTSSHVSKLKKKIRE